MPLYEYECDACGNRFERIRKFSDPPLDECPKCGAKSVHKLLSSPAIQFKGTGWYITDYARKDSTPASKSESSESKSEKTASDAKTDKPADSTSTTSSTSPSAASSSSGSSTTKT